MADPIAELSKEFNKWYVMYLDIYETTSIANNTSTLYGVISLGSHNRGYISAGTKNCQITIDGKSGGTGSFDPDLPVNASSTPNKIKKWTGSNVTVTHGADGKKTITVSCSVDFGSITLGDSRVGTVTLTGTVKLTDILRKATVTSAQDFNDSANPVMNYSNPAGNAVTKLSVCISLDKSTANIAYRDVGKTSASYTFNLTDAERNVLRNAAKTSQTVPVYFFIRTEIGGTVLYDYLEKKFTLQNTTESRPSVSLSVSPVNTSLPSDLSGLYIRNRTKISVAVTASGKYGATISEYSTNVGGTVYNTASFTSGVLVSAGNVTVTATVKDSRGFTNSASKTVTVYDYKSPTISPASGANMADAYRANADGTRNSASEKIWISAKATYSALTVNGTNLNTVNIRYRYRQANTDGWSGWSYLTLTNGEFNGLTSLSLDTSKSYVIQLMASDRLDTSDILEITIPTKKTTFNLGENGDKAAFFKYAEREGLEVPKTIYYMEDLLPIVDFVCEEGVSDVYGWRYRKWYSGRMEMWRTVHNEKEITSSYGNGYFTSDYANIDEGLIETIKTVQATIVKATGLVFASVYAVTLSQIRYYIASMKTETVQAFDVHLYVEGTWK